MGHAPRLLRAGLPVLVAALLAGCAATPPSGSPAVPQVPPAGAPGPAAADAFERAELPGPGLTLAALWLPFEAADPAGAAVRRPVVIALHGCGGLYTARGTVDRRYRDYAARWHAAGWHVLAPDSFTPRGFRQICTERNATRTIRVVQRRDDVAAAFRWLARRPDVDPTRIALVGWSNGGSTLLEALDASVWGDGSAPRPAVAVAFYPGCRALAGRPSYRPVVPLLMLLGAEDDWTPPAWCHRLHEAVVAHAGAPPWQVETYPGSVHGFDGTAPVRVRSDVPNGVDPAGVHVGANPVARDAALQRMDAALHAHLDRAAAADGGRSAAPPATR